MRVAVRGPLVLLAPLAALACALSLPAAAALPHRPAAALQEADDDDPLRAFAAALAAARAGDERARATLADLARRCADERGRDDVPRIAAHYLALDAPGLARGRERESAFRALWDRVVAARERSAEAWKAERRPILDALERLAAAAATDPDFVPAAQAHSLAARLLTWDLETHSLSSSRRPEFARQAEHHARRALELFERAGQRTPRLEPTWVLARLARLHGRLGEARTLFARQLEDADAVGRPEWALRALHGAIAVVGDMGDVHEQRRLLERLALRARPEEHWPLARAWSARLLHDEHPEEALEFLERCEPDDAEERHEWSLLRASAALRTGRPGAARADLRGLDGTHVAEEALLLAARCDLAEDDPEAAIERLRAVEEGDLLSFDARAHARSILGEAYLEAGAADDAALYLRRLFEQADERARALLEAPLVDPLQEARVLAPFAPPVSAIGEWEPAGMHALALLAEAALERGDALEAARVIEDGQSRGMRRGDEELRRLRALAGEDAPRTPVAAAEVAAWAAAYDDGLATWVVGADATVAVWVDADGRARGCVLERGRVAVAEAVRRLREAALAGDADAVALLGAELAAALLPAPLLARLESEGSTGRSLLCLLHGPLEALPLELLSVAGLPLGERVALAVLPGLPAAAPGAAAAASPWHLLGAPTGPTTELPGARAELESLAQRLDVAGLHVGDAFTRERLEEALLRGGRVHVATHLVPADGGSADGGSGDGSARFAPVGLALQGGDVLSAGEIADLAPRADLVVLAACESGGGRFDDGEGLSGVARAFLESGTRSLLVTLWPVDDDAARRFALAFHERLALGDAPSEAARSARARLAREGLGPADAGAFRLLGRD